MNSEAVITVRNLSKSYKIYDKPIDLLKESLLPFKKKYHDNFSALEDVSFEMRKGETIGIIGINGAGKSTLLKILTGVLTPTSGEYEVRGKVAALLELGTGFNPELTGIENIYFYGALAGFNREEMKTRIDDVVAFADIGDFIHHPLKTYSSGMTARVAFAAAIHVDPEILIVDEALAVGDARFSRKCMQRMEQFCKHGTVLMVTHDIETVRKNCDTVLWMDQGRLRQYGDSKEVTEEYIKFMYGGDAIAEPEEAIEEPSANKFGIETVKIKASSNDFGDGSIRISEVYFKSRKTYNRVAYAGEPVELGVIGQVLRDVDSPILGFELRDKQGQVVLGDNTSWMKEDLEPMQAGQNFTIKFNFKSWPNLKAGDYGITLGFANGTVASHEQCHYIQEALAVRQMSKRETQAIFSELETSIVCDFS